MNRLVELLAILTAGIDYSIEDFELVDQDVNDCLIQMYLFMKMQDDDPNKEKVWKAFSKSYEALEPNKQEYVQNDFFKIIKAQDENQKQLKKER